MVFDYLMAWTMVAQDMPMHRRVHHVGNLENFGMCIPILQICVGNGPHCMEIYYSMHRDLG